MARGASAARLSCLLELNVIYTTEDGGTAEERRVPVFVFLKCEQE